MKLFLLIALAMNPAGDGLDAYTLDSGLTYQDCVRTIRSGDADTIAAFAKVRPVAYQCQPNRVHVVNR